MLCHRIFVVEAVLNSIILLVVLLILLENFGVLREVLLIRNPVTMRMLHIHVLEAIINSARVVMIDTMLNILEVIMSYRHTHLDKALLKLLLRILELILELSVLLLELFRQSELSHLVVDLSQLLHLQVVLTDNVLLLLSKVTEIASGSARIDLTRGHALTLAKLSTCSENRSFRQWRRPRLKRPCQHRRSSGVQHRRF